MTVKERLLNGCIPEPNSGCWIWLKAVTDGHGRISVEGESRLAHQVSYEEFVGPVPKGKHLSHNCRVGLCINYEHLTPRTQAEHSEYDGWPSAKISASWKKSQTHCKHGHEYTVENTGIITGHGNPYRYCKECHRLSAKRRN